MFATELAAGLVERGWEASVVALAPAPGDGAKIDVPVLGATASGLNRTVVAAIAERVRSERPDVVVANGGATLRYAVASIRGRRRRPRLVYGSIGEPMYWVRNGIHRRLLALQLSLVDAVFAVSEPTRRQLVDRLGVAAEKVEVTPTGVSDRWLSLDSSPESEPLHLVWIGSISAEKNPALALDAFEQAAVGGARLVFVGDGPLRSELEARSVPGVAFVGSVSDVGPYLQGAGGLVLSSKTEGLPGAVLEALAAGVPVVATDVGGVADLVIEGRTGFLVRAGDVEAMVDAIRRLGRDPGGRATMGASGRELVADRYRLSHSIDRYDAALRRVVKGPTP